jgi:DNA polymerase-3 subunit delta'
VTYPWLEPADAEFSERFNEDRLPHALLLHGPRDTGKTALAVTFIASILCLENQHPACGSCRSCQLLQTGAHPDRHIITFEENPKTGVLRKELVVSQVRKLISSLNLTNTISKRKAALIHPVEASNKSTINALLKTLEEPPGETVLVLVSHDSGHLPATIRSRCQNLHVRPAASKGAIEWLCSEAGVTPPEAETALRAAAGSPLKAARMVQDGSIESYHRVISILEELRAQQAGPGAAAAALAEVDPELLWSWISLFAAEELKKVISRPDIASRVSRLQSLADRNRGLLPTPVRKDFLMQDWLIQWARIRA